MLSRRHFLSMNVAGLATAALVADASAQEAASSAASTRGHQPTRVQLIRSATVKISLGDTTFLIDPMLAAKGEWPGFALSVNSETRNPMIDLPMPVQKVLDGVDAIILTHLHEDHWDEVARKAIPKDMPIFVNDEPHRQAVLKAGFRNVEVLVPEMRFKGVCLTPTMSQHGTDEVMYTQPLGDLLGTTMGVVFSRPGCRSVYLAGDTIWKPFVTEQLQHFRPDIVILNTGNALMAEYAESIIMGGRDFMRAYREAPWATIVAVHMDAINHCVLRRRDLRDLIKARGLDPKRALVHDDGETLSFA